MFVRKQFRARDHSVHTRHQGIGHTALYLRKPRAPDTAAAQAARMETQLAVALRVALAASTAATMAFSRSAVSGWSDVHAATRPPTLPEAATAPSAVVATGCASGSVPCSSACNRLKKPTACDARRMTGSGGGLAQQTQARVKSTGADCVPGEGAHGHKQGCGRVLHVGVN